MGMFNKRKNLEIYVPIPDNLRSCTVLSESYDNNASLKLVTKCICGSNSFKIKYFGEPTQIDGQTILVVKDIEDHSISLVDAECIQCTRKYNLFDARFQGNDGFFNILDIQKIEKPELDYWKCEKCHQNNFYAIIEIETADMEEFAEENEGEIHFSQFVNAFHWIWISLNCNVCNHRHENFIDYECA